MMISYNLLLKKLLKQVILLFVIYELCRLLFYFFNRSSFTNLTISELSALLLYGLRFDAFSIAATNGIYICLYILPFKFQQSKGYQKTLAGLFIITNSLAIALNFMDFGYFPFTQKRTTFEVFHLIFGGQSEFLKLLPHFIKDFWYLVLLYVLVIWAMVKIYNRIQNKELSESVPYTIKRIILYVCIYLGIITVTVIGIRGGLQKIPIVLLDAAPYTQPKYIPVLINTPFSLLKSADLTELKPLKLMDEQSVKENYNPIHAADTGKFTNQNICIIILESFSKEFTGISNRKSYTPFLDSMMSKSIVYANAVSNGKTSINGIPAIVASIPSYLENHYLNSMYSNNTLQTLPNLLKQKGYNSAFYHGGTNGTMNFNSFANLAGFDSYFGRTEYGNDDEYDGQWGIWDEPFLTRVVQEMSKQREPFFTSIFTLSSHNPYTVPAKYKGKFPKGSMEIHESIGYTDFALRQFFNEARKQKWFDNTLFIITPDHTATSDDPFYSNIAGQYAIPIILYKNNISPKIETKTVQQIDILPTILDYLNYDQPYYAFGESMLRDKKQPAIYYLSPNYGCVKDSFLYILSNYKFTEKYNFIKDSSLSINILDTSKNKELLNFCKAYIQTYNNDVINNNTSYRGK